MTERKLHKQARAPRTPVGRMTMAGALLLSAVLIFQGCFAPVYPQLDREERVMRALDDAEARRAPPMPLTPTEAVRYALEHNLDAKVAEIDAAYQNESLVAARRRLLPGLTLRYSPNYTSHPAARWSESAGSGEQSLESSFSSEQYTRQSEVGMVWNLIDFGVGYLRTRQQGERILHADQQRRRVRQQVVLDVLSNYWRASAALRIAEEAETLRGELEEQAEAVRDSVELRILSGAEGARRELAIHGSLAELEQHRRAAAQAKLELARVLGCGGGAELILSDFADAPVRLPDLKANDPWTLQAAALKRRPELFQQDAQERIAVDEARLALLQIAPNASLSLSLYDDPDKFLEWGNWMTAGVRISWNLFNIPARLAERRMAKTQEAMANRKGLALAAAVMSQVGIAYSDWILTHSYAATLDRRAASRERLVEALAAGEEDGQTRPGEVLHERVRLLSEKAAALRSEAEVRVAGARLANAIGLDVDDNGKFVWRVGNGEPDDGADEEKAKAFFADLEAEEAFPDSVSGIRVVKAETAEKAEKTASPEPAPWDAPEGGSDEEIPPETKKFVRIDMGGEEEDSSGRKDGFLPIVPDGQEKPDTKPDAKNMLEEKPVEGPLKINPELLQAMSPPASSGSSAKPVARGTAFLPKTAFVDKSRASAKPAEAVKTVEPMRPATLPKPLTRESPASTATSMAGLLPFALDTGEDRETAQREKDREAALQPLAPIAPSSDPSSE